MSGYFNYTFPLILGTDVSGVIEEVGPGVTKFKPGDEVYTRAGVYQDGSYAEYVRAMAEDVAPKPLSIDHIQSAAIPHVTLTAYHALYNIADIQQGETVLIHAAAGGVGHIAVQLAKLRGAKVIGTSSINIDFLERLGVDQAINYTTTAFEDVVHDVDVVLDTIGGDTQQRSWSTLKPGGILISTVQPPSEEIAAAHGVRQAMLATMPPTAKTLMEITRMVDMGLLRPYVSTVLNLKEIHQAHQLLETRHTRGKIVLTDGH
jgi:NADPH:quinone reductase-like Zn-dependent oxidoreductase